MQKGANAVKKARENANIISDEYPLATAGLEIYPNRFKWSTKTKVFYFQMLLILKSIGNQRQQME